MLRELMLDDIAEVTGGAVVDGPEMVGVSGEEVVTSGVFKLRNGAAVLVNNQTKPGSSAAPKPEDS